MQPIQIIVNKQILKELKMTAHASERMINRLEFIGIPKEFISFLWSKINSLEKEEFHQNTLMFFGFLPENPKSKYYKKFKTGDYTYQYFNNGVKNMGNEVWGIIKNDYLVTIIILQNSTKKSDEELLNFWSRKEIDKIIK